MAPRPPRPVHPDVELQPTVTVEQVADALCVNFRTVHRMIHSGKLHAFKAGNQWRIPADALRELMAAS
jgi:excisionase family DNA binding protein